MKYDEKKRTEKANYDMSYTKCVARPFAAYVGFYIQNEIYLSAEKRKIGAGTHGSGKGNSHERQNFIRSYQ